MLKFMKKYWFAACFAALFMIGEVSVDLIQPAMMEKIVNEGILGIVYTGELVEECKIGEYDAVVPTVGGQSWIYGYTNYVLDPTDPFENGFIIGDIWA